MFNVIAMRNWLERQVTRVYSRLIGSSFCRYTPSYVHPTARIDNSQHIILEGVSIGRWCWIYAMTGDSAGHSYKPEIIIGKGTQIGDYCHITCATKLAIGQSILITQGVLITDSIHVYSDPTTPIINQGLSSTPMSIGDGSWIGNHAAIIGCSIGKHCVVGANAVVTHDVPDYCVVAGSPAKIIKRYDNKTGEWVRPS
jgi:acetyltransferase-like isoleucine patch superfamily enzyme